MAGLQAMLKADLQPSAWRVVFGPPKEAPGEEVVAVFADPSPGHARATRVEIEELLTGPRHEPLDQLDLIFLPSGVSSLLELQRQAEAWMARPAESPAVTLELVLRSDRILWRPGQALVIAAPERAGEIFSALCELAHYEGQLRGLEQELARDWAAAEADVPLTSLLEAADLAQIRRIREVTKQVTLRRMRLARIWGPLEKAPAHLSGPARRLMSELLVQGELLDRLKIVDDRLEVFEDLYELANDRLSEFRHFRVEYLLELWIIVLLALEVVLILLEWFW